MSCCGSVTSYWQVEKELQRAKEEEEMLKKQLEKQRQTELDRQRQVVEHCIDDDVDVSE